MIKLELPNDRNLEFANISRDIISVILTFRMHAYNLAVSSQNDKIFSAIHWKVLNCKINKIIKRLVIAKFILRLTLSRQERINITKIYVFHDVVPSFNCLNYKTE